MGSLRTRLIFTHLLPLFLLAPLTLLASLYLVETQLVINQLSRDLTRQAELIAEMANTQTGIWADSRVAVAYVERIGATRVGDVTLFTSEGVVLATTDPRYQDYTGEPSPDWSALAAVGDGSEPVVVDRRTAGEGMMADVAVSATNDDQEVVGIVQVSNRLDDVTAAFQRLRGWMLVTVAVELVLGAALGLALALQLERPLRRVTNAIQEIAAGGRVEPVPEQGPRETRLQARAVNALVARLNLLEETRRRLLANLVHELGRPLGAMRAAIDALRGGGDADPALRRELLDGMARQVDRLNPLLADLSQLHAQVLGTFALDYRDTPLSQWLPTLLPPWRAAAQQAGLTWKSEIPDQLPTLAIDPDRLAQAVGNLVSNAIRYSPAGGAVRIEAGADETHAWIAVSDSGPGIPSADRERIFEAFQRGSASGRFPQGLGLGLTIARDLVQAHSGTLSVESAVGEGSRFTIELPLNSP